MQTLYELARQVNRHRDVVEALLPEERDSPLRKLSEIVFNDRELTDEESMRLIYPKRNITAFSRLKFRLKELFLQVMIFQIPNSSVNDIRTNEALNASRYTLLGRCLVTRRLNKVSAELIEKSISRAIKYHITDEVLAQSRILINYYSGNEKYNKYKSKKYLDIQKKYFEIYEWENKVENYFLDLQNIQYHSLANVNEETKRKAKKYCEEINKIKHIHSYRFIYNKYRIFSTLYEYDKNYSALLDISEQTLQEFSAREFTSPINVESINVRRLWAMIQAGRFQDTISVGLKAMSRVSSGDVSWYRLGHYILKAYLYSKNYDDAVDFISSLINHPKFKKLSDYYHELFFAALGYIHLLVDSNFVTYRKERIKKLPEFKLGKFLNTTPVFSKDKRGINVSILLMHIAFLLQRKDYNAIIDRTDSLNQYAYRYLRRDDSFRSNCMIKMVIQMTKADFHPVRTERYTTDLRKQLSSVNLAGSGENIEIEIIPFEVLWDIMIKSL